MLMLWIVTGVLSYAQKLPYIKQIIAALSIIYGRTTIWKVLVKLRKAFIMFNAIIGVYMVYKSVGFNYENVLAGFMGMGHSYLEIFANFTKRLFHWFVELFDHKLVPNVPGESSGGNSITQKLWTPRGLESNSYYPAPKVETSLRKSYNSLLNLNVESSPSWYKDLTNWWWLGGILVKGAAIVGVVYFGYKFIVDPLFIKELGTNNPTASGATTVTTTITGPSPEGSITPTADISTGAGVLALNVTKSIIKGMGNGFKKLNPTYWFITSTDNVEQTRNFLMRQCDAEARLPKLYPYTEVNPFDSWIKRMIIYYLGETTSEMLGRERLAKSYLDGMTAHVVLEPVASGSTLTVTPSVGALGLSGDLGFYKVAEKISSVPSTPGMRPLTHVISDSLPNPFNDQLGSAVNRLKNLPFNDEIDEVAPQSPVALYHSGSEGSE
jgi:hypothetical protein